MIVNANTRKYRELKRGSPYQFIDVDLHEPFQIKISPGVDVNLDNSPRFEAELFDYLSNYGPLLKNKKVIFDVSPAHTLSSAVLAILEKTKKRVAQSGGKFKLNGFEKTQNRTWAGIYSSNVLL